MQRQPYKKPVPFGKVYPSANPKAIDLLTKMLIFDPAKRITVESALRHPYLASLHRPKEELTCPRPFSFEFEKLELDKPRLQRLIYEDARAFHPSPISSGSRSGGKSLGDTGGAGDGSGSMRSRSAQATGSSIRDREWGKAGARSTSYTGAATTDSPLARASNAAAARGTSGGNGSVDKVTDGISRMGLGARGNSGASRGSASSGGATGGSRSKSEQSSGESARMRSIRRGQRERY